MSRLSSLNLGQRIVLIVALGCVLRAVGVYILVRHLPPGGWFNYEPLSSARLGVSGLYNPVASMLVVVALTIVWAGASVWLLGLRQPPE